MESIERATNLMTKQIIFLPILLLVLYSCDPKKGDVQQENKTDSVNNRMDMVEETDLSRAKNFYNHIFIRNIKGTKLEFIDSLHDHFDSLQIRLWNIGGLSPGHELYLVTKIKSKWTGTYFDLQPDTNYISGKGTREFLTGPIPLDIQQSKAIQPKIGWIKFIDSLITLQVMTLPDMEEVPGMKVKWTDSPYMIIEFSTKDKYRFYEYSSPDLYMDSFWQAGKAVKIQSLFYTQF